MALVLPSTLRSLKRAACLLGLIMLLAACEDTERAGSSIGVPADTTRAGRLIAQAIAAHGMEGMDRSHVAFDFRGVRYEVRYDGGLYHYSRTLTDSAGAAVREVLSNDSLYQTVDGVRQELTAQELRNLETRVNSVVYFTLLPYKLQDPAVQTQYLGPDTLKGVPYERVEVTFAQEGGGRDWEDRFVYWIHPEQHTMDYLGYYYYTDETGTRFREATNVRTVGGVRVQDYVNYAGVPDTVGIEQVHRYGELLRTGAVDTVSMIRTENFVVERMGGE